MITPRTAGSVPKLLLTSHGKLSSCAFNRVHSDFEPWIKGILIAISEYVNCAPRSATYRRTVLSSLSLPSCRQRSGAFTSDRRHPFWHLSQPKARPVQQAHPSRGWWIAGGLPSPILQTLEWSMWCSREKGELVEPDEQAKIDIQENRAQFLEPPFMPSEKRSLSM
jgi:hypothetical protein